jgi:hypothetical protein
MITVSKGMAFYVLRSSFCVRRSGSRSAFGTGLDWPSCVAGVRRYADNARFVEFAVSSTMETKESLEDGVDRGCFTPERVQPALELATRSIQCSVKYILYLKRCAKIRR